MHTHTVVERCPLRLASLRFKAGKAKAARQRGRGNIDPIETPTPAPEDSVKFISSCYQESFEITTL